jgi:hypothetical protein
VVPCHEVELFVGVEVDVGCPVSLVWAHLERIFLTA